ncbi:MAG: 16S rRNA (guanine(527)-N(7))-methyltransferase RsmG [Bacilli bacterium]|nr:16S rRNA (guanine(527)-N(7))-methyltransferase RsmG [Bacilli bacterium]MDD4547255.1 16S rRNA (guanine(527)-N(7))-methyltransferase RsmG [Bacilli bacterium]
MTEQEFVLAISELGIDLTDYQLNQFKKYYELLIEWNEKMNLTGITQKDEVYLKHFYDSATLTKIIAVEKFENLCDVGSGAGFPGIIIKILYPALEVTLIDSLMKRITFLNEVIKELKLEKINTIHCRIEDFGQKNRETFDIVTARAVAPLNILLEYCIPIVKKDKFFVPLKGNISREIKLSNKALTELKCKVINKMEFYLPIENSFRSLILIKKEESTPSKYPRRFDKIKKNPL